MSFNGTYWLHPSSIITRWYKRKFAILPVMCNGERIWFKFYYQKHDMYGRDKAVPGSTFAITEVTCITEADYIIDKLTDGF